MGRRQRLYAARLRAVQPAADHVGQVHRAVAAVRRGAPYVLRRVEDVAVAAERLEVGLLVPQRLVRALVSVASVGREGGEAPLLYRASGDRGRN